MNEISLADKTIKINTVKNGVYDVYCLLTGDKIKEIDYSEEFIGFCIRKLDFIPNENEVISHVESFLLDAKNPSIYSHHTLITNQREMKIGFRND